MSPISTLDILSLEPQYYMSAGAGQSYVLYMYIDILVARHIRHNYDSVASGGLIHEILLVYTFFY